METSRALIEKITDLGLQPYEAPDPLDPIAEEEVKLVCWMAVTEPADTTDDVESSLRSQVVFGN